MAELIGGIFKTHPHLSAGLISQIYQEVFPKILNDNNEKRIKMALFLICDMVEFLGLSYLGEGQILHLAEQLFRFITNKEADIR